MLVCTASRLSFLINSPLALVPMAHSTRGLWHTVIEQWRNEFSKRECPIPTTVVSEKAFRTEFQELCRSRKEYFYTTLLVKLRLATINALSHTIDATFDYEPPFSLAALVFGTCFVSVQVRLVCQVSSSQLINHSTVVKAISA